MKVKLVTGFILMVCCSCYGEIVFSPSSWELGSISKEKILELRLAIENREKEVLSLQIIPTCDCAWSEPTELTIQPGATGNVLLFFDPHDETGDIDKNFMIKTNINEMERLFYLIRGKIKADEADEGERNESTEQTTGRQQVELYYYYLPSCAHCRKFIETTIPQLERELGVDIVLITKDIMDIANYEEIKPKLDALGEEERAFPILFIGKTVLQGEGEIDGNIREQIKTYIAAYASHTQDGQGTDSDANQTGTDVTDSAISVIPAITAGLLDGINPCAFATLISLLTALALAGKRRKEILIIGIFFTLSVFTTYYLVGLGLFKVIQTANSFPIASLIIHWVLVAILIFFAALSIYDFYLIKVGRTGDMILQLPDSFKKRIQKTIKTRVRSAAIVASSIVLGFLVSIFELGCTGQVYFPFITVNVLKIKKEVFGYVLLLIYNLCFIVPLVLVFAFTYLGISSKKVTNIFQRHMATVKLLLAGLFIGLAVYMILSK